ncbi:uncharacterized protein LOC141855236 [Brevipalpus obovatus]|uniref:uncharacterized protein LOC141855236 n=1 Tax=Brevipalpus obovatus TaxID=246614 RepID=UPI003D9E82D8
MLHHLILLLSSSSAAFQPSSSSSPSSPPSSSSFSSLSSTSYTHTIYDDLESNKFLSPSSSSSSSPMLSYSSISVSSPSGSSSSSSLVKSFDSDQIISPSVLNETLSPFITNETQWIALRTFPFTPASLLAASDTNEDDQISSSPFSSTSFPATTTSPSPSSSLQAENNNNNNNNIVRSIQTSPSPNVVRLYNQVRFWIQRILVPIVVIIGVIGNSLTIVIMTRRRMRSSTNFYLAALAAVDMIYLIFIFILSLPHYPHFDGVEYRLYWTCYPVYTMIVDVSANASVWLTVTFTFERFIVVTHPIRGKVMCTEARSKKVIIAVFIICLTWTFPTPFEWKISEIMNKETNRTSIRAEPNGFDDYPTYKTIYYWVNSLMFTVVPLILLAVFNWFLIYSVRISRKARSEMTQSKIRHGGTNSSNVNSGGTTPLTGSGPVLGGGGSGVGGGMTTTTTTATTTSGTGSGVSSNLLVIRNGSNVVRDCSPKSSSSGVSVSRPSSTAKLTDHSTAQETKITIMLIAVVVLFLVCQLPQAILWVYKSLYSNLTPDQAYYLRVLSNVFNLLVNINAAGNFILYSLLSQRYRRTFVQLFCPCLKSRLSRLQSHQRTMCTTTGALSTGSDSISVGKKKSSEYLNAIGIDHHHRHSISSNTHCGPLSVGDQAKVQAIIVGMSVSDHGENNNNSGGGTGGTGGSSRLPSMNDGVKMPKTNSNSCNHSKSSLSTIASGNSSSNNNNNHNKVTITVSTSPPSGLQDLISSQEVAEECDLVNNHHQ